MSFREVREYYPGDDVRFIDWNVSARFNHPFSKLFEEERELTVMLMVDGRLTMAVVPASLRVDLYRLKKYLGAETVELASENEFRDHFADCETGSMPPFGNLYGMDVFVDQTLAENLAQDKEIAFNAGSHRELVRMRFADFRDLVKPAIIPLAAGRAGARAA